VFFSMYMKRLRVYREGGFELSSTGTDDGEAELPKGQCLFIAPSP
jgi:hypothetical protein